MRLLIYIAVLCSVSFCSCKKIINVDTINAEPLIVIEGTVVNGDTMQIVSISKSVNYSERNNFPRLTGAKVTISDDRGGYFTLVENANGFYSQRFRGRPGTTYTLNVDYNGRNYQAVSKMPSSVRLDSLTVTTDNFFGNDVKILKANYVDPIGESNYYQFNLYVNNFQSQRIYVSDDRLTNGNKIGQPLFFEGTSDDDDDDDLKAGDQITVDMRCISEPIFKFWYSLQQQTSGGPNQKTTPSNPPSNISNNALGYFSAQTTQRLTSVVK